MTEKHGSLNNAYTCTLIMYINSPTDGDVSRYQIEGDSTWLKPGEDAFS